MLNNHTDNQFYQNTHFNLEEQNSLQAKLLGFGGIFKISFDLFKKCLSSLFLPVLVWQLLVSIFYLVLLGCGAFYLFTYSQQGSTTPAFFPLLLAFFLVTIIFVFFSSWISTKATFMINDTSSKLFDSNRMIGKFFTIVGFTILFIVAYQLLVGPLQLAGDSTKSSIVGFIIGFIIIALSILLEYVQIVINYIIKLFLYENKGFLQSVSIMFNTVKNYFWWDVLRQFIFLLVNLVIFAVAGSILFFVGIFSFLPIVSRFDYPANSDVPVNFNLTQETLLPSLISFGIACFFFIVLGIIMTWFVECYYYVSYYNLRMLELNNPSKIEQNLENSIKNDQSESQTLEQKLMGKNEPAVTFINNNSNLVDSFAPLNNQVVEKQVEVDQEALAEYQLMDIDDLDDAQPTNKPTVIGTKPTSILNLAKINKAHSKVEMESEIDNPNNVKTDDDLKIIEGIGPKIEQLLKTSSITSYAILADTDVAVIEKILSDAGSKFSMHNPLNWPVQSALARDGKLIELEDLKKKLNAGL
jgi:predicted flap endonuclease-1-like 5' DNA nuclease